jgi:magnesium transporter
MLHVFILGPDGTTSTDATPDALRQAMRSPGVRFWLDIENPSPDEIALLNGVFGFHHLAIEDTIGHVQRPKIEDYSHSGDAAGQGYFYMVFHGPDLESFRQKLRTKELDIFVSATYLVTVHDEPMHSVELVRNRAAADTRLALDPGIDFLLHNILDHMTDSYQPILDFLEGELDRLEEDALAATQQRVLTEIALRKRDLLNFRRIIGPQREVLAQITRGEVPFLRESTRIYMRDVLDHVNRAVEMIELYRDLVSGARDIYLSSVSNKLNGIMKALTLISVIALPMTVITSFFGMNFDPFPGLHTPWGLWSAVAAILVIEAVLLALFWKKRWI